MAKSAIFKALAVFFSLVLLCSCTDVSNKYIIETEITESVTNSSISESVSSETSTNTHKTELPSETSTNIHETELPSEISTSIQEMEISDADEIQINTILPDSEPEEIQHESPVESISEPISEKETTMPELKITESKAEIKTSVTYKSETYMPETTQQSIVLQTGNAAGNLGSNSYKALNYEDQKGIWISYLEYDSIMKNKSKKQFTSNIRKYFDNISDAGFNTVYVHVRAFGDAYYNSELFPSGDRFNGTMGTKASYDPLQIMIDEAHSREISIHAWVNPMRLMTETQLKSLPNSNKVKKWYNSSKTKGKYIVYVDGRWYLNPSYDEVNKYICDGITEIISKYDVDGIQIDDYFYPTTAASFDSAAYKASGTSLSLSKWRIQKINLMVKDMYNSVHSCSSSVVFGISPQGSLENNYDSLYADVKTWCSSSGYCDYILPQVYFGFDNPALPFDKTIDEWSNMVTNKDVQLVIGLAGYKVGVVDTYAGSAKNEWINNKDIIGRQINLCGDLNNYGGIAIFRYGSIFTPSSSISAHVNAELKNIKKEIE